MNFTAQEMQPDVASLLGHLATAGVQPGDRVALLAGSNRGFVAAAYAVMRLGAVLVPLHSRLPEERLASLLGKAEVALLLHDDQHSDMARGLGVSGLAIEPWLQGGGTSLPAAPEAKAAAAVLFTSGTTGTPRGAILTHGNFAASAAASSELLGTGAGDTWLTPLPLFHVGGLALLSRAARDGFRVEAHADFDPEAVAEALGSGRVTHASLVARTLERTLEVARGRFHRNLRAVLVGGGPTPDELMERARERGLPVVRTYGLTEACSQVTTQRPGETDSSSGRPLSGTKVTIEALGPGVQEGEILVEGPTVMQGYLGEPALEGRPLRTGDIGRIDESGRLFVLDRRTDLIVTGGENVYPAEVEAVLSGHPGVAECCVVGTADASWGQRVQAVVRPRTQLSGADVDKVRPLAPLNSADLDEYCRARLAPFQVPRSWTFSEQPLPRTASGKIRRDEVRGWVSSQPAE